ncbi:MAG: urate oxidase / 2-oxo-4-hydroxy-4-carboxy-5-ureidoimidazoline decarboxylase [Chloroflexota bacterium]|nr:urate oxidase / 2-oxo-4-hydroxy-4-carboxy-5-ureidoimidazoline decarboxylase [Chloroflexota bacterium]
MKAEFHYGKAQVSTYRTYATPLAGLTPIPESSFTGRPNVLLAAEIDVQVMGDSFLAAYTEGDNSNVVATDTMKNFIHRQSLAFTGATLEGWLFFLGEKFLETYPQMERLRVSGQELSFEPARVPSGDGTGDTEAVGFEDSTVLFHRRKDDRSIATVELDRTADGQVILTELRCGRTGLQLIKVTGSAFLSFPRDEFTTLPERKDRPLFIYLDIAWRYVDPMVAVEPVVARYVAAEQVADLAAAVFHQFVSLSIQHLVHEIGTRMLDRWPQLDEVSFEAQNRLWDTAEVSEEVDRVRVYTDPRPPYGRIGLTLRRE